MRNTRQSPTYVTGYKAPYVTSGWQLSISGTLKAPLVRDREIYPYLGGLFPITLSIVFCQS